MKPFDTEGYLERIGVRDSIVVSEAGLEILHRAQSLAIPFENFDIMLGRGIELSATALMRKLLPHGRGGYCFELNGLFHLALRSLGFSVRPLLARVHGGGQVSGRTHLLLLVTLSGRDWITDVGFGANGLRAPLVLEIGHIASQGGEHFRLADGGAFGYLLQVQEGADWCDLYSFDLAHVCEADITLSNHYTSTHPDSKFTRYMVATIPTPDGRISLRDFNLRIITPAGVRDVQLESGPAYLEALDRYFGIRLGVAFTELAPPVHR